MVKGLDVFHEYFHGYANQYVLIGGAACSISFEEQDAAFRATKDLDMVLIVEALTASFGTRFWQFIRDAVIKIEPVAMANLNFSVLTNQPIHAFQR